MFKRPRSGSADSGTPRAEKKARVGPGPDSSALDDLPLLDLKTIKDAATQVQALVERVAKGAGSKEVRAARLQIGALVRYRSLPVAHGA